MTIETLSISKDLINKIKESKISYSSVSTESYTENVNDQSFFSEGEEVSFDVNGIEYIVTFDVNYTWVSVNSGGDGWNDENYDYPENECSEVTIKFIIDGDGLEYEADYEKDKVLLNELSIFLEESI